MRKHRYPVISVNTHHSLISWQVRFTSLYLQFILWPCEVVIAMLLKKKKQGAQKHFANKDLALSAIAVGPERIENIYKNTTFFKCV